MARVERWRDWLRQAENDLKFARHGLEEGFYAQSCFISQQAAEKALKAALYARGARVVLSHGLVRLCAELDLDGRLREASGVLDQYYLSGRYPDALPDGAPFEVFTRAQATQAVRFARTILKAAKRLTRS